MTTDHEVRLPLFTFGTLRRGRVNHHYLAGRYERVLTARLPGYAVVSPLMIDRSHGGSVPGELFVLRPAAYERRRVAVLTDQGSFDAWAYVRPETRYRFSTE